MPKAKAKGAKLIILPDDWHVHKTKIIFFGLSIVVDAIVSALLFVTVHGWHVGFSHFVADWRDPHNLFDLSHHVNDVVVLTVIRLLLVPAFTLLAITKGSKYAQAQRVLRKHNSKVNKKNNRLVANDNSSSASHRQFSHILLNEHKDEERVSLLDGNGEDEKHNNSNDTGQDVNIDVTGTDLTTLPLKEVLSGNEEKEAIQRADRWKYTMVALLFVVITTGEVYIGVKSITFQFHRKPLYLYILDAALLVVAVACMNVQLWLSTDLANKLTREAGHYYPQLHRHALYFDDTTFGHRCDLCHARGLREAYRCRPCDFDMCLNCVKRNNKSSAEGLIRTDKGIKEEQELSTWHYFKTCLTFVRPHAFVIAFAFVFLLLTALPTILIPNYQGKILDMVIKNDSQGFFKAILIYVAMNGALGLFGGIRNFCFTMVGQKMLNNVRTRLFASIIRQDIAFFDGIATGELTSRFWNDSDAMISPVTSVISSLLSSFISLIGGLVMCLYTSWQLSILAFTTIGPITLIYKTYARWSKLVNKLIFATLADANAHATEVIRNVRTVRAFSQEEAEEKKYLTILNTALRSSIKDAFASASAFTFTSYIDQAIGVLLLWYGGSVVMNGSGDLTVGKLITFQLYWNMINSSYTNISGMIASFTRAGGAAQRVLSLFDNLPDIKSDEGEIVDHVDGDIKMEDVEFFYQMRPQQMVLKGVNLHVGAGQVCALVGRSGGGKSTITHMLMRFYDPKKGRILLDGRDLRDLNPISLRRHMGIVAQDSQLFNTTIEKNIAYGVEHYTESELHEAARLANAHEFIMSFDEGYQTRVGESATRISGGQKQRLALARVFLRRPKVLLLDEATSSLDAESEALVQEAIDKLIQMKNCTVILVAHRLSTVINADSIAVVDQGTIVEQGNHQQLLQKGGIYAKLVERQVQKMQNSLQQGQDTKDADVIDSLIDLQ